MLQAMTIAQSGNRRPFEIVYRRLFRNAEVTSTRFNMGTDNADTVQY